MYTALVRKSVEASREHDKKDKEIRHLFLSGLKMINPGLAEKFSALPIATTGMIYGLNTNPQSGRMSIVDSVLKSSEKLRDGLRTCIALVRKSNRMKRKLEKRFGRESEAARFLEIIKVEPSR